MCFESGIQLEKADDGSIHVVYIENGDYIKIRGADFKDGSKKFVGNVSSDINGGNIEVRFDKKYEILVATCTVEKTGSWHKWQLNNLLDDEKRKVKGLENKIKVIKRFNNKKAEIIINFIDFFETVNRSTKRNSKRCNKYNQQKNCKTN